MTKVEGKYFKAETGAKTALRYGRSSHRFFVAIGRIDGKGTVCFVECSADETHDRTNERVEKVIACLDGGFQLWRAPEPTLTPADA